METFVEVPVLNGLSEVFLAKLTKTTSLSTHARQVIESVTEDGRRQELFIRQLLTDPLNQAMDTLYSSLPREAFHYSLSITDHDQPKEKLLVCGWLNASYVLGKDAPDVSWTIDRNFPMFGAHFILCLKSSVTTWKFEHLYAIDSNGELVHIDLHGRVHQSFSIITSLLPSKVVLVKAGNHKNL